MPVTNDTSIPCFPGHSWISPCLEHAGIWECLVNNSCLVNTYRHPRGTGTAQGSQLGTKWRCQTMVMPPTNSPAATWSRSKALPVPTDGSGHPSRNSLLQVWCKAPSPPPKPPATFPFLYPCVKRESLFFGDWTEWGSPLSHTPPFQSVHSVPRSFPVPPP